MRSRRLEASRLVPVPPIPYTLIPEHLPFAMVFARTTQFQMDQGDRKDDRPESELPAQEPTWSNAETTSPDSNDPSDDEEIDWLQDD